MSTDPRSPAEPPEHGAGDAAAHPAGVARDAERAVVPPVARAEPAPDRSPEEIERDIARTREELGATVNAVAARADVKSQLQRTADEQKAKLHAKQDELKARFGGGGSGGGGAEASERLRQAQDELVVRTSRRPLPYLAGALAAGLALGLLLRGRRR